MSVNGAARVAPTLESILADFKRENEGIKADLRQRRGFQSTETKPIGTAAGATAAATAGFLKDSGDQMLGPIALAPLINTIISDAVNISKELGQSYTSYILLNPEGGVADTLATITGAAFPGQIAVFQVTNASITFTNTANINAANITVNAGDNIAFIFDLVSSKWQIWSGAIIKSTNYKSPVRVATTINGALATAYANGQTVDGIVLSTGNRILLKDQTSGPENGIYTVNATGDPTRASDFASGLTSVAGSLISVEEGTVNDNKLFIITTNNPTTVGTTSLAFSDIASGGEFFGPWTAAHNAGLKNFTNTADITPGAGSHQVGTSSDFYNQIHSQFFVPEAATIITNRFGISKTGNTLYVNFDNTNNDAGFGIYEQGLQRFLFSRTGTTPFVNEFHIGGNPFLSGEEYRIQMGENSTSSARIFFIEGTGNDLILDRAGGGLTQGVQVRVAGITSQRWLSNETILSTVFNVNAKDMKNVVDIKSNGGGSATTGTIGELITANGGFNYFMRNTLTWESDPDVKISMSAGTLALQTNSNNGISIGDFGISIFANNTGDDVFLTSNDAVFVQSNTSGKLGFFDPNSAVIKQVIASDTLANLYTALRAYNLIG